MLQTIILPFSDAAVAEAAERIRAGEPVAVATETVYGLAADATNAGAVASIYRAKGRPSFNPLIVHVPTIEAAERLGVLDARARALAEQHWPGPLTLVVPARVGNGIDKLATAGLPSIAIRIPAHRAIRALLNETGVPLAAPSANASGRVSPTTAAHVLHTLDGRIGLVIDDGRCAIGVESTIVAATGGPLRLLRSGEVGLAGISTTPAVDIRAPGQLASHYAPSKPLRLNALERRQSEYLIGFGAVTGDVNLSITENLIEAASHLFDYLHLADASASPAIAVAPIPHDGIGVAINDRLQRAAA